MKRVKREEREGSSLTHHPFYARSFAIFTTHHLEIGLLLLCSGGFAAGSHGVAVYFS